MEWGKRGRGERAGGAEERGKETHSEGKDGKEGGARGGRERPADGNFMGHTAIGDGMDG